MNAAEAIATVLGVAGVALLIRRSVWGWPVGIVQVAVSAWVFWQARLYSDVVLQGLFACLQAYGWWNWTRGRAGDEAPVAVTRLGARRTAGLAVTALGVAAAWGEVMRRATNAALPHADAFILVFSVAAQVLQARRRLEAWAGWMAVNGVAVAVYASQGLRLFAGLYAVFLVMAVAGHVAWRRAAGTVEGARA